MPLALSYASETGHHAIAIALVFHLEHHALVRLVESRGRLGHDAVETRAFEAAKPIGRDARFAGCGSQVERRRRGRKAAFPVCSRRALKGFAPQIAVSFAKQIEKDDGCRRLLRQKLHPRRGRMNAELERLEVETAVRWQ